MIKALKASYWLAFALEILSTIIWVIAAGISALLTLVPAALTVWLFIIHRKSYRQLSSQNYVSTKLMRLQTALGISIATALAAVAFFLANLDCLDVCTHAPNHLYTVAIPEAVGVFLITSGLAVLPYLINRKIMPSGMKKGTIGKAGS